MAIRDHNHKGIESPAIEHTWNIPDMIAMISTLERRIII